MQAFWALLLLAVTLASCTWAWRRTRATLAHRGWRPFPSHCVGATSGALAAVLGSFMVAVVAAPGISLIGRLLFLFAGAVLLGMFWRVTAVGFTKRRAPAPAVPTATDEVAAPPARRVLLSKDESPGTDIENTFAFTYRKPDGTERRRTVRVERHGFDGSSKYIEGHCSDAHASRSFRLDRVKGRVTVLETGELISAGEMYRRLGAPSRSLEVTSFSAAARAAGQARRPGWQIAVYFAGFGANQYGELAELAEAADMDVRASISRTVDYVVTGNLAGRQQIAQAKAHGIAVIDEETFRGMV